MAVVYQRGSWYYGGENYDVYFKGGYTYFSDISGEEIDDKEVYYYNGKHCNRDEIIELLGYIDSEKYLENYVEDEDCEELNEECHECPNKAEYYNTKTQKFICEKCLIEEIEEYRLKLEDY